MKQPFVVIGIVILLACIELSGCSSNPLDPFTKFVGTWTLKEGPGTFSTIVIHSDKTALLNPGSYSATCELTDTRLIFHLTITPSITPTYEYKFENDKTLVLTLIGYNVPVTYTKS